MCIFSLWLSRMMMGWSDLRHSLDEPIALSVISHHVWWRPPSCRTMKSKTGNQWFTRLALKLLSVISHRSWCCLMLLSVLMLRIIVHLAAMMRRGKISGQDFLTGFHTWSQRREDDHNKQCNICEKKVFVISGSAITLWILWIPQQIQRKSCKKYHHNLKFCGMLVNQVGDQRSSTMFLSDPGRVAKSDFNSTDAYFATKN